MSNEQRFYAVAAVIGTVVPWIFFGSFVAAEGLDLPLFVRELFANGPAAGFSSDVVISIGVFWVWSWLDSRRHGIGRWWLVVPSGFSVGLSLALPLYLFVRAGEVEESTRAVA